MTNDQEGSSRRPERRPAPESCPLCGGNGWLPRQRSLPPQFYQRCACNPEPEAPSFGSIFIQDLAEAASASESWTFHQLGAIALDTIEALAEEGMNREVAEWVFFRFFDVMDQYRRSAD